MMWQNSDFFVLFVAFGRSSIPGWPKEDAPVSPADDEEELVIPTCEEMRNVAGLTYSLW